MHRAANDGLRNHTSQVTQVSQVGWAQGKSKHPHKHPGCSAGSSRHPATADPATPCCEPCTQKQPTEQPGPEQLSGQRSDVHRAHLQAGQLGLQLLHLALQLCGPGSCLRSCLLCICLGCPLRLQLLTGPARVGWAGQL